uniref:NADH dehydrogenase subunit 3 n=1 Tax=Charinus carajas TaxID=3045142 RepID=UPI002580DDA0|nr:NADH dehydrogenase subunit 3 [Charinus carajas]WGV34167.1 NADH dehydrogenase subunit 3 [Charinus carajas]WGV34180.1 NADH dehydrogenase subunit 3 [Charinus carajas]WGV34193.1 NADH dehydrogenase subunit 3 [Charinus carajas]
MHLTMFLFLTLTMLISTLLTAIPILAKQNKNNKEKLSPYECGFDPLCHPRIPLSLRFFLIAILFLIFDVEISLILPIPFSLLKTALSWAPLSLFLVLLSMGLLYEWKMGSLEWAK